MGPDLLHAQRQLGGAGSGDQRNARIVTATTPRLPPTDCGAQRPSSETETAHFIYAEASKGEKANGAME